MSRSQMTRRCILSLEGIVKRIEAKKQDLKAASQDSAVQVKSVGRRFWIFLIIGLP